LLILVIGGCACVWILLVVMNPWALHIGGISTPLLYWNGSGTVVAKGGKTYPLYVTFWPGKPSGFSGGGRRSGKHKNADLSGTGYLCIAPGNIERMKLSGDMYGGYKSTEGSLMDFRVLEWRKPFQINPQHRGFFDIAGSWHGSELVMDRPGEQGVPFKSGLFIDNATVTLRPSTYAEFESACRNTGKNTH
jgi:hypothetical protein